MSLPSVPQHQLVRVATLLASGIKPSQVASIVGWTPARVSQLSQSEDFQLILREKMEEASKKDVEEAAITAKYLTAEHILIDQIVQMAPSAELRDVTQALRVVAERQEKSKQRMNPAHANLTVHQHIVQLTLPKHALPEITVSSEREVIAIDDMSMAPLTATGVENLFSQMKEKENGHERIPGSANESFAEVITKTPQLASSF